jgi:hypothetical protein
MDKLNKRERKEQRKEAIKAYQPTPEQIEKFKEDFNDWFIKMNIRIF